MVTYEMSLAQRVLNTIADPNIVYLLMMAGILGLYIELTHPGVTFPGIAGGICFLLALAALQVLPVNYSGLALILLGAGLLIAEAYLPTFGVVGAGGIIAFMLGSLFLFDTAGTGVAVSRALVFSTVGVMVALAVAIGVLVVRSQRRRVQLGHEGMIGQVGVARQRLAPDGTILVRGEYWTAESDVVIDAGERVEVMAVDGLRLRVRRKE
jgi:membrane-bound serine protease (ClpP class)